MGKIDTTTWGSFELGKLVDSKTYKKIGIGLFDIYNAEPYHSKDITETKDIKDSINYVTRSKFDNGVKCRVVLDSKFKINPKNTISFGAENANFFYQEEEYITGNKMYYIDTSHISKYSALFIKCILESTFTNNFSFTDGMIPKRIYNEKILLPIKSDGSPDWEYMEEYMKTQESLVSTSLTSLLSAKEEQHKIDLVKWKRFHLYDKDLFEIDAGTKFDKSKMTELNPTIDFIGRSGVNNGITMKCDIYNNTKPYQAGNLTLSLGGEYLGSCFIQESEFYTSQNVIVLKPTWDMPYLCKKFICTMVFKESRTYYKAFVDELNRHIKTDFSIYLPIKDDNTIDWVYIENYMSLIEQKVKNTIAVLNLVS